MRSFKRKPDISLFGFFLERIKVPIDFYRGRRGIFFAIFIRHIKTLVPFKIKDWRNVELPQTMFYGCPKHRINGMFVIKFYFGFCRMDIDVDGMWIDLQKKKVT